MRCVRCCLSVAKSRWLVSDVSCKQVSWLIGATRCKVKQFLNNSLADDLDGSVGRSTQDQPALLCGRQDPLALLPHATNYGVHTPDTQPTQLPNHATHPSIDLFVCIPWTSREPAPRGFQREMEKKEATGFDKLGSCTCPSHSPSPHRSPKQLNSSTN